MAVPVGAQKVKSYSGIHESGLSDQLKAVKARCDSYEVQTSNKGQNRSVAVGEMSPNFTLYQPSNDYDKGVLSRAGYVLVSGPDSLGNKQEGYIEKSKVNAFRQWFNEGPKGAPNTFLAQAAPKQIKGGDSPSAKVPSGIAGRRLDDFKSKLRSVGSLHPVIGPENKSADVKGTTGNDLSELKKQIDDYANSLKDEPKAKTTDKSSSPSRLPPSSTITVSADDLDSVSKPLKTTIDVEFTIRGEKVTIHLGGRTGDTGNLRSLFGTDLKASYWTPSNYKEVPPQGWLLVNESVLNGNQSSGPTFLIPRGQVSKDLLPTLEQGDRTIREEIASR